MNVSFQNFEGLSERFEGKYLLCTTEFRKIYSMISDIRPRIYDGCTLRDIAATPFQYINFKKLFERRMMRWIRSVAA